MSRALTERSGRAALALAASVPAAYLLARLLPAQAARWLLPVLVALPAWLVLARLLRKDRRGLALGLMLVWAAMVAFWATGSACLWHQEAWERTLGGPAYVEEMSVWLASGQGRESEPRRFVPQHLRELALFVALCLASGSLAGLLMGAVLMDMMALYVGSLVVRAGGAWPLALLGWHPWSWLRIAAYVALGVVAAEPLLRRGRPSLAGARALVAAAAGLLLLDAIVKALWAPGYRLILLGHLERLP